MVESVSPPQQGGMFDGVQCLRLVAALMVVVMHSTFYASERLTPGSAVWQPGLLGVDIFFVISGFVMFVSSAHLQVVQSGWREFVIKRLIRIVPLYWAATSLKLAILLAVPAVVLHSQLDWGYVWKSYFFIPAYNIDGNIEPLLGVGWTLIFEMFFYALFTLTLLLRLPILPTLGVVLTGCAIGALCRQPDWPAWTVYLDMRVLEFLAGMLIGRLIAHRSIPLWVGSLAVALGFILILFNPVEKDGFGPIPTMVLPATIVVFGVVAAEPHLRGIWPRWWLFFGAASYSLYLIHPIVAPGVPAVMNKLGLAIQPLSIVGSVCAALVAASIVHLVFEKPMARILGKAWRRAGARTKEAKAAA